MFKLFVLCLFIFIMFAILKGEKRATRFTIIAYFSLLSIVFLSGIIRIAYIYHLYDGPVLDGGFQSLSDWVGVFSFLYIIPSTLITGYVLFKLAKKMFDRTWVRTVMYVIWLVVLLAISYVSFFIFTLIFYGFAP